MSAVLATSQAPSSNSLPSIDSLQPFPAYQDLVESTKQFVQKELSQNDASHDWLHISRVYSVALSLAREEGIQSCDVRMELIELSALLHDIADWKYSGSETQGMEMAKQFLQSHQYDNEKISLICHIIDQIGFKSELGRIEKAKASAESNVTSSPSSLPSNDLDLLIGIVQDSDRLDAIGAIGIARCFTFGGFKKRSLYDPSHPYRAELTMESYKSQSANSPSINHFYEKLLKLKDLMKTRAGRKRAEQRHQVMVNYLQTFHDECEGRA